MEITLNKSPIKRSKDTNLTAANITSVTTIFDVTGNVTVPAAKKLLTATS